MVTEVQTVQNVWPLLTEVVFVPHAQSEYQRLTTIEGSPILILRRDFLRKSRKSRNYSKTYH